MSDILFSSDNIIVNTVKPAIGNKQITKQDKRIKNKSIYKEEKGKQIQNKQQIKTIQNKIKTRIKTKINNNATYQIKIFGKSDKTKLIQK